MPELPEVETTLRGIMPHLMHQKIADIIIRHPKLRWEIPTHLKQSLRGLTLNNLRRRGKYLIFEFTTGALILHLGMSGRLHIIKSDIAPKKHDHIDICFANNRVLRFSDPRRFGALLWSEHPAESHKLLANLGIEPLTRQFNGEYLYTHSRKRKSAVKTFIMDSHIATGIGNIYATEALFDAGILPMKPAGKVSLQSYKKLVTAIKSVLKSAIKQGGTTLKDFRQSDGKPGYFKVHLNAYGKGGEPCPHCKTPLSSTRLSQRSTVYCKSCQR